MPISVRCPKCGHGYQLRDELAGKQAKCRCGQTLAIPIATTLTSLLDEEHIGQSDDEFGAAIPPAGVPPMRSSHAKSSPRFGTAFSKKKKKFGKGKNNQAVIIGSVVGGVAVLFVVLLLVFLLTGTDDKPAVASVPRQPALAAPAPAASLPGQATPQETFDSFKTAWVAGDWGRVYSLMTPKAQTEMVSLLATVGASLGPLCPELSAIAKQHGVEPLAHAGSALGSSDPFSDEEPEKLDVGSLMARATDAGKSIQDKRAFFADAMPAFVRGRQSATTHFGTSLSFTAATVLSDLQINGQTATGTIFAGLGGTTETTPLRFSRRSGSWYMDFP